MLKKTTKKMLKGSTIGRLGIHYLATLRSLRFVLLRVEETGAAVVFLRGLTPSKMSNDSMLEFRRSCHLDLRAIS
jgi:hypothetical protein